MSRDTFRYEDRKPELRISVPIRGTVRNFDWSTFQPIDLGRPPKRPQHGGVPKGRIWTHVAAEQLHWAEQFGSGSTGIFYDIRRRWLGLALNTIYQHARAPETRAEALRLLAVLETRG